MTHWIMKNAGSIGLVLLSSLLLTLSFPGADQGWLAWFALVPLILACNRCRFMASFLLGLLGGITTMFGVFYWIFQVPGISWYHGLILALFFGTYSGLWCSGLSILRTFQLPFLFIAPAMWVSLDYLKGHAGFMALPWATLAHSQHNNLAVIQISSFTGEYGVTFLVVMASVAVAETILHKNLRGLTIAACIIALAHTWGFAVLSGEGKGKKLTVAVVQPSILLSERETASGRVVSLDRLERLTHSAAQSHPALFVWPETAVQNLDRHAELLMRIKNISRTVNAPIITGSSDFRKFSSKQKFTENKLILEKRIYNSAYFITPGEILATPYRKRILLPFGEYLPFESSFKWPNWLVPKMLKVIPGDKQKQYVLLDGTNISPIICWESLFANYVRRNVKEGASLIALLTNDNWFGVTAAPYQHNLASVFRAVENRVPIVIASNSGPSQIIDPFGRVLAEVPHLFSQGAATADVELGSGNSFYTKHGDFFALICIVGLLMCIPAMKIIRMCSTLPDTAKHNTTIFGKLFVGFINSFSSATKRRIGHKT